MPDVQPTYDPSTPAGDKPGEAKLGKHIPRSAATLAADIVAYHPGSKSIQREIETVAHDYDDKWVSVQGVVEFRNGNPAIFLSAETATHGILSSGIWLDKIGFSEERWRSLHRQWVGVRGVFDKDSRGHLGMFAGTIRDIDHLTALPLAGEPGGAPSK